MKLDFSGSGLGLFLAEQVQSSSFLEGFINGFEVLFWWMNMVRVSSKFDLLSLKQFEVCYIIFGFDPALVCTQMLKISFFEKISNGALGRKKQFKKYLVGF